MNEKHVVTEENAAKIWDWLRVRGGLAVWESVNLSNPGASWTTPANQKDGTATTKPTWEAGDTPTIITNPADVVVSTDKEVKRFHIGVRMGDQGFMVKVTDGGTRRIRSAVAKAGKGAYYIFDYDTQEAVIFAPVKQVSLPEWIESQPKEVTV